jgi:hypothetical protein
MQSIGASDGSTGTTASSIIACWAVFTELLPGNALIKSVNHATRADLNDVLHKYHPTSLCLYVYPATVARQRRGKKVTAATNTHATIELLDPSFSVRFVSYQKKVGD